MDGRILLAISIVFLAYWAVTAAMKATYNWQSKRPEMDCMDELRDVEVLMQWIQPARLRPSIQRAIRDCRAVAKLRYKVSLLRLS